MGFVYFAEDKKKKLIKIGFSQNPRERAYSLGSSVKIIGYLRGGRKEEKRLHNTFREFHTTGEWFRDTPEMRAFMAKLKLQNRPLNNLSGMLRVRVPETMIRKLRAIAVRERRDLNDVMRMALEEIAERGSTEIGQKLEQNEKQAFERLRSDLPEREQ